MPRVVTPQVVADFRERVCDAASELLAERGMDGFNMRELAKRLRVSPMTAYRYFRDKDEILTYLRVRGFARLADAIEDSQASGGTLDEATAGLVRAYVHFAVEDLTRYRLMFDLFQAPKDIPELHRQQQRVRRAMSDHANLLTQSGAIEGEAAIIGPVLWSTLHGVVALHLSANLDKNELEQVLAEAVQSVTRVRVNVGLSAVPRRVAFGSNGSGCEALSAAG